MSGAAFMMISALLLLLRQLEAGAMDGEPDEAA